jgi:hypothetical protein
MTTPTGNLKPGGTPPTPPRQNVVPHRGRPPGPSGRGPLRFVMVLIVVGVGLVFLKPISDALGGAVGSYVISGIQNAVDPACGHPGVTISVGRVEGAAGGTSTYPLVFTNHTGQTCSVSTAPSVVLSDSRGGGDAGRGAHYTGVPALGTDASRNILPYQYATVLLRVVSVHRWHAAACGPVRARYVGITFGGHTWWVPLQTAVCTRLANSSVSSVMPE